MKRLVAVLIIFKFLISSLVAEMPTAQFLLLGDGVRAEAMGQSIVAHPYDHTAVYWNPAALPFLSQGEIGLTNIQFPTKIQYNSITITYPYKYYGFGINAISYNTYMDFYDGAGDKIGSGEGEKNLYYSIAGAYKFSPFISFGLRLGFINMDIFNSHGSNYKDQALNTSIAGLYTNNRLSIGFTAQSGEDLYLANKESQPKFFRLGAAYHMLEEQALVLAFSYTKYVSNSKANALGLGAEYTIFDDIMLRAGYNYKKYDSAISFGLGVKTNKFVFDYSFTPNLSSLNKMNFHRVGVSFKFGQTNSLEYKGEFLPPEITLQYFKSKNNVLEPKDTKVYSQDLLITAKVVADNGTLLDTIKININGKERLVRKHIKKQKYILNAKIKLEEGINIIEIIATHTLSNISRSKKISIEYERNILKGEATITDFIDFVATKSRNWAILIGAGDYDEKKTGFTKLDYVENDVISFKKSLVNNLDNFDEERIYTLGEKTWSLDDDCNYVGPATRQNIESFLGDKLPLKVNEEDRVLIFFSGHGITVDTVKKDSQLGFIAPIDGIKDEPFATCISMDIIKQLAERIPAKQILFIIDACNSGIVLIRNKGDGKNNTVRKQIESFLTKSRQAMTAGQSKQATQISSEYKHSIYTHYLLEGLEGNADNDKDGVISVHDLHVYVRPKVSTATNNMQIPQMGRIRDGGEGDFFFILKNS